MGTLAAFRGAAAAEFRMQARKRSLWVTLAILLAWQFIGTGDAHPLRLAEGTPAGRLLAAWALMLNVFTPIGVGTLLADRLPRDRRLGTWELLESTPAAGGALLWGKYAGATLATLLPAALYWAGLTAWLTAERAAPGLPLASAAAFALVVLPGMLFVAAFSVACTALLWPPLYRVLFVGYWFWGNLLNPDLLPTLSGTVLTPVGSYAAEGLFGADSFWGGQNSAPVLAALSPDPSPASALASVALLLALAALALDACRRLLAWQARRR